MGLGRTYPGMEHGKEFPSCHMCPVVPNLGSDVEITQTNGSFSTVTALNLWGHRNGAQTNP